MNPKVRVVIPVYNRADRIAKAVKSVTAQTYRDLEVIVADDGSTDAIEDAVHVLSSEDSRVRFVRLKKNKGAQAARNAGIHASRSDWVAFLDSDDEWLPRSLELRILLAEKENLEVVHSEANLIEANGVSRPYGLPAISGWVYKKLLEGEGPMFQTLLVSKKAIEKIGYLDEQIVAFQEWDTVIRLSKYFQFGFVPEPTFVYDCRGTDTISKQFARGGRGYEQILKKHWWEMFRVCGAATVARHYEGAEGWYKRGGDTISVSRCHRAAFRWKMADPGAWKRQFLKSVKMAGEKTA